MTAQDMPAPETADQEMAPKPKTYKDLGAWRKAQLVEWTLPSGLIVKARANVTILDLIEEGAIPESLLGFFQMAMDGETMLSLDKGDVDPEQLPQMIAGFNAMARAVLVEPKIGDQPTEDTITLAELDFNDKAAIFNFAQGGAGRLAPFRQESSE